MNRAYQTNQVAYNNGSNTHELNEILKSTTIIFSGGHVPLDRRAETKILLCISRSIFWWLTSASICGIFASFYFLWINVKNGSQRYIYKFSAHASIKIRTQNFSALHPISYFSLIRSIWLIWSIV